MWKFFSILSATSVSSSFRGGKMLARNFDNPWACSMCWEHYIVTWGWQIQLSVWDFFLCSQADINWIPLHHFCVLRKRKKLGNRFKVSSHVNNFFPSVSGWNPSNSPFRSIIIFHPHHNCCMALVLYSIYSPIITAIKLSRVTIITLNLMHHFNTLQLDFIIPISTEWVHALHVATIMRINIAKRFFPLRLMFISMLQQNEFRDAFWWKLFHSLLQVDGECQSETWRELAPKQNRRLRLDPNYSTASPCLRCTI